MAARRRRATRVLTPRHGPIHHYGARYAGYGHKPALAPVKSAKKSLTKAKASVKKAAPSAAKTVAVRKVKKAETAVKVAEKAVVRVRSSSRGTVKLFRQSRRPRGRRPAYGSPEAMIRAILAPKKRGRPRKRA